MSKNKNRSAKGKNPTITSRAGGRNLRWIVIGVISLLAVGGITAVILATRENKPPAAREATTPPPAPAPAQPAPQPAPASASAGAGKQPPPVETMEVAKAVMVTVELDFGPRVPTIAEALGEVERQYKPEDGSGRTFAILDAYGEPTPDGKLLHMSMHVSSEEPGMGVLKFKRTGEILWQSRITPASVPPQPKSLQIMIDNGAGTTYRVDPAGATSVINAKLQNGMPVKIFWPDGAEREVTFIYSMCGCPVKVTVRRTGERTMRTKDLPVMFPDDPEVMRTIKDMMKW